MPIDGTQTVAAPIAPGSVADTYSTHIDEYGRGGYRAITSGGTGTATNTQIGNQITLDRRKVGMLIYDVSTSKYYRCTGTSGTGTYTVEDFGSASGVVTSVDLSMPDGFAVTGGPIDSSNPSGTLSVSTSLTGLIKGDGAGFSAAVAGTDYAATVHTHLPGQITNVDEGRLLGRHSAGKGATEQIQIGTGLTLAGGVLTAEGLGGTVTAVSGTTPLSAVTADGKTYIVSHDDSGVQQGTYGNGTTIPAITVDRKGHITGIAATPISGFLSVDGGTLNGALTGTSATFTGLTINGDVSVTGTTTTINSTTVEIEDKNIELAANATTDAEANGGGITVQGATPKTLNWLSTAAAWTSSENLELAAAKQFRIDGANILSKTALGSTVSSSSLQSVGTLTGGTWQANEIGLAYGGTGADLSSASVGTILKVGASGALVAANAGSDYLSSTSAIDGGSY